MLLRHHTLLCRHKRFRHLLDQGVYLADRSTDREEMLLFQLGDTYVEVAFARHMDTITWAKCFIDTNELEPYLQAINIETVLG